MKKLLLLICMIALGGVNVLALQDIPFLVRSGYIDPKPSMPGSNRSPVAVPLIAIDGHTLYLYNVGYDLTLRLLDEDGEEVYTVTVAAGTTSVELPATLTGPHTLQLFPGGSYYFEGIINF